MKPEEDTTGIRPEPAVVVRPRAGGITWRLIVLVVVVLGVAIVLAQSLRIYFLQSQELAEVRAQIAKTEAEIADQRDQLERWNDPAYVRSQARVRLGWVMPGEVGYRVIGPDGKPLDGSETVGDMADEPTGPWYERMWTSVQVADEPAPEPLPSPKPDERVIGVETPSPTPSPSPSPTNP
ncbi:FtsB family cell division protein [Tessaracoccus oleiagri]|uniref:Cell division protein FtsB n=1 Tax=Tessaracoccus oleiagri TaxID=686624 RepID=A0A1G9JVG2_9ACTN|nr:septum formation initiator family protein [Tessaracoccus oleiagri]SDL41537.1 Cell division protein FtsB [Tessaracoccus oleiagri]